MDWDRGFVLNTIYFNFNNDYDDNNNNNYNDFFLVVTFQVKKLRVSCKIPGGLDNP